MLINGIARTLIDGVPDFLGGFDMVPSNVDYLGLTDFIPVSRFLCNFNDDVWDMRKGFRMQWRIQNKISFKNCHPETLVAVKCFVVKCLDNRIKVSTMHTDVRYVIKVLNLAITNSQDGRFRFIEDKDVIKAIDQGFNDVHSKLYAVNIMKKFFAFLEEEMPCCPLVRRKTLEQEQMRLYDIVSKHHNTRHYPPIPAQLYDGIAEAFYRVLHNEDAPLNDRFVCGIIFIDMQLGLRKSEICALETDCLGYYTCDDGSVQPYVEYGCIKASRGDIEVVPIKTFCNEDCHEALRYFLSLRERCKYAKDTDFLLVLDDRGSSRDGEFPVDPQTLSSMYQRVAWTYAQEHVSKTWKGLKKVNVPGRNIEGKYTIPPLHCIRTTVASMAVKQGFPVDYMECAMSHAPGNSFEMGYYGGVTPSFQMPSGKVALPEGKIDAFDDFMNSFTKTGL